MFYYFSLLGLVVLLKKKTQLAPLSDIQDLSGISDNTRTGFFQHIGHYRLPCFVRWKLFKKDTLKLLNFFGGIIRWTNYTALKFYHR